MHLSYLAATLLIVKHLLVAPKVRDSWEELLDVETDWDEFLAKVKRIVFTYVLNTSSINNHHNPTRNQTLKQATKAYFPQRRLTLVRQMDSAKEILLHFNFLFWRQESFFCKCYLLAGLEMKLRELNPKKVAAQKLSYNWTCLVQAKTGNKTSLAAILDSESTGRCLHLVVRSSSESEKILR